MRIYVGSFNVAQVDGPTLASSSTATSLLQTVQKKRLDPGFFQVGRKLIMKAHGRVSVSGAALNLTLDVRLVGQPDATSPTTVVVANGGAMVMTTSAAKTNVNWKLEWELVCRAIGASANLMHTGEFKSEAFGATSVVGEAKACLLPASAPAVGSNFDSSQIQVVDLFGTWGTNSASNSITVHGYELISEN